jgi:trans-aconitate methyltransferase
MTTFNDIASRYREISLVQAPAGEKLIGLLEIPCSADILDAGCGAGNLTAKLLKTTNGFVTGIDSSDAMIREAIRSYPDPRIRFLVMNASSIGFENEFDIVFCNSALQWFRNPAGFLVKAHRALRPGGRFGVQAPAKTDYCPVFLAAIEESCTRPEIRHVFSGFKPPWFLLESGDAYAWLIREAGFTVLFCSLEENRSRQTPEKVFDIFSSGAKAGYLNPDFYAAPFPDDFETAFLEGIRQSFVRQADADGMIDLVFNRIYVIAER